MGYNLFSNPWLTISVQARTNKNKRINKKWLKRYGYKQVPDPNLYEINGTLYGHPDTVQKVCSILDSKNQENVSKV